LEKLFKLLNYTKIILLWQVPNVLPEGSCLGMLVLKPCFLGLYAPPGIPSRRNAAKPCCTWLLGGKILELPEPIYLCIKKMRKLKETGI